MPHAFNKIKKHNLGIDGTHGLPNQKAKNNSLISKKFENFYHVLYINASVTMVLWFMADVR